MREARQYMVMVSMTLAQVLVQLALSKSPDSTWDPVPTSVKLIDVVREAG